MTELLGSRSTVLVAGVGFGVAFGAAGLAPVVFLAAAALARASAAAAAVVPLAGRAVLARACGAAGWLNQPVTVASMLLPGC
jgi:hypothetical protein